MESEEEGWEQTPQNGWDYKREDPSECKYFFLVNKNLPQPRSQTKKSAWAPNLPERAP